jgi:hypothetical protein
MNAQIALGLTFLAAAAILAALVVRDTRAASGAAPAAAAPARGGRHRADRLNLPVIPVLDDVLPFLPPPDYDDEPDDWTADLPTGVIPIRRPGHHLDLLIIDEPYPAIDRPRHTSPSESAADDWPPIFAQLAGQWGYDHERGFEGRAAA